MSDLMVTNEDAQVLLDSAMTTEEKQQRDSSELAIQVAGMEIHESPHRDCTGTSSRSNNARLFRGDEGGQTWDDYLAKVTPKLTPDGEGFKKTTATMSHLSRLGLDAVTGRPATDRNGCSRGTRWITASRT